MVTHTHSSTHSCLSVSPWPPPPLVPPRSCADFGCGTCVLRVASDRTRRPSPTLSLATMRSRMRVSGQHTRAMTKATEEGCKEADRRDSACSLRDGCDCAVSKFLTKVGFKVSLSDTLSPPRNRHVAVASVRSVELTGAPLSFLSCVGRDCPVRACVRMARRQPDRAIHQHALVQSVTQHEASDARMQTLSRSCSLGPGCSP